LQHINKIYFFVILHKGINRFKQHFSYSKDKSTKEIDLNSDEKFSVVYEYLQTSTECKELFRIWDMQLRVSYLTNNYYIILYLI
jgi:hypothetical protein